MTSGMSGSQDTVYISKSELLFSISKGLPVFHDPRCVRREVEAANLLYSRHGTEVIGEESLPVVGLHFCPCILGFPLHNLVGRSSGSYGASSSSSAAGRLGEHGLASATKTVL
ncbi:hypothetical protein ACOMHN_061137 [Nucella lapillus]